MSFLNDWYSRAETFTMSDAKIKNPTPFMIGENNFGLNSLILSTISAQGYFTSDGQPLNINIKEFMEKCDLDDPLLGNTIVKANFNEREKVNKYYVPMIEEEKSNRGRKCKNKAEKKGVFGFNITCLINDNGSYIPMQLFNNGAIQVSGIRNFDSFHKIILKYEKYLSIMLKIPVKLTEFFPNLNNYKIRACNKNGVFLHKLPSYPNNSQRKPFIINLSTMYDRILDQDNDPSDKNHPYYCPVKSKDLSGISQKKIRIKFSSSPIINNIKIHRDIIVSVFYSGKIPINGCVDKNHSEYIHGYLFRLLTQPGIIERDINLEAKPNLNLDVTEFLTDNLTSEDTSCVNNVY